MSTKRNTENQAASSGVFRFQGKLPVYRLGFGAMRITGPGIWGEPRDPDEAIRVLRRAVEIGINFIDTADSYGPEISERLIGEALYHLSTGFGHCDKSGLRSLWSESVDSKRGSSPSARRVCSGEVCAAFASIASIFINCIESIPGFH